MSRIGTIERTDLVTGQVHALSVRLMEAHAVERAAADWLQAAGGRPERRPMFNWPAVSGLWPQRYVLGADFDGTILSMIQLDENHPLATGRSDNERFVYISFLEVAPGERSDGERRRFAGLGTALLNFAVARSVDLGYSGKVGLYAIPAAESYYRALGFEVGGHANEYWETFFVLMPAAAERFLK